MDIPKKLRRKKPGSSPGSLILVGEQKLEKVKITLFDYSKDHLEEKTVETIEECLPYRDTENITWINIDGLHDTELIKRIGQHYIIHPLTLEDILDTSHRPKVDDMEHYFFISLRMLTFDRREDKIKQEQISIVLGDTFIISFQEDIGDIFDPIRNRLRSGRGRMRKMGADYLAYSLLDAIVDNYFLVVEEVGEHIEALDKEIIECPNQKTINKIHDLKRELIQLRKAIWPLRDMISSMERAESELINDNTTFFLRDLYDHSIQVIDTVETYRDLVSGLFEIYLSNINVKTNEIMKLLTMMSSIFIPLTFLVGVYGMNFRHFPELDWYYGYAYIWGIMLTIAVGMLIYFRRRRWI